MSSIANTTVLSNFAAIEYLDMLRVIFPQLYISTDVYAELEDGVLAGYTYLAEIAQHVQVFNPNGWITLTGPISPAEFAQIAALPVYLHRGEASSIALAAQRDWLFLTDDRTARTIARRQGVRISGTLGCLLRAIPQHSVSVEDANQWLGLMIAHGYRAPIDDLRVLLSMI